MISVNEALQKLKAGNDRFVSGELASDLSARKLQREMLVEGQAPFAIILGCSDSRVPVEMVFDQSLGDLFVIRVAGNIATPTQIASVEFAAQQFATPLVVVLGHSMCGAVKATLSGLEHPAQGHSPNLLSLVNCIRPAVEPLFSTELRDNPERLLEASIRANVLASAKHLIQGSAILEQLVLDGRLKIVGAEYSLQSGEVTFYDEI